MQIIVCLTIGAIVGVAYTKLNTETAPQYQSTAQVYITTPASNIDDVIAILSNLSGDDILISEVADTINKWQREPSADSMVADYTALFHNQSLLEDVIQNLSLDMSPATLENMLTINSMEGSHVVEIVVSASNAQEAENIIGEVISQGEIYFQNFFEEEPPKLLGNIKTTVYQPSTDVFKSAVLAGLIVAILYCGVILVRFLMDDTVVTPDDVVEYFGVQPLATIPVSDLESAQKRRTRKDG